MDKQAITQQAENKTSQTNVHPLPKRLPAGSHSAVLDKAEQFREKVEALSKPTLEWTITSEDPL